MNTSTDSLGNAMKGRNSKEHGWSEVRRKTLANRAITTFYVAYPQADISKAMLAESFHRYGQIMDIYIPGRKDKSGSDSRVLKMLKPFSNL